MTAASPARSVAGSGTAAWLVDREALRLRVLFLMLVGSAFVFAEPSPYEIGALGAIACFAATGGLRLRAAFMPLALILVVYCLGLTLSAIPVLGAKKVAPWIAVSWYLAVTMVFFAIVAAENTAARMDVVVRAWTIAALIAAIAGIAGYFRAFPGAFDLLTLYGRAKGTFNDPNVFGPFLILPMLTAMQAIYAGGRAQMARAGFILVVLLIALLLSFSRGAWIHFVLSAAIMTGLLFLTAETRAERRRILVVVAAGLVLVGLALAALLSIDKVADLMKERASFNQSYDHGPMGRFGRHAYGWQMALDMPMGIGPLQFTRFFPEDVHNVYLNAFMSGGWTAGIAYHVLVGLTLFVGLLAAFRRAPWRPAAIAVFATFCGLAFEGKIIDTDHWRHFWALGGLLWGLAVAGGLQPPPKRPKSPGTVGV